MASKPAVGIYFTDDFIEASVVSSDGSRLTKFNHIGLPRGLVVNGEVKDEDRFKQMLIGLLTSAQPSAIKLGEDAIIGVQDNRVFLREFTLPKLTGRDVDEAIDWQVKSLLPVLPAEVETDRHIIGKDANGQIEVLLAAVPKQIVQSYLKIVDDIGLNVISIEPAVFASIRIIDPSQLKGKNQLLINIGDDFTEFTYLTNGNPRFSDFLNSDELERKGGVVKAVRDNIGFANSKHPTRPVQEVIISGFSPRVEETANLLKAEKIVPVLAVSRLANANIKDHGLLHTSHGLSLKSLEEKESFNLLPAEFRLGLVSMGLNSRWKTILSILVGLTLIGDLGLIFLFQYTRVRLRDLTALDTSYKQELSSNDSKNKIERIGEINKLTDELFLLRDATGGEDGLLKEIAHVTPNGITLSSIVYSRGLGALKLTDLNKSSWIITGNANSREEVLAFYEALLKQPDFSNGKLYFGSLEKQTGIIFRIASQVSK